LASALPNPLLNHWSSIIKFFASEAQPAFAASGGVFESIRSAGNGIMSIFSASKGKERAKEKKAEEEKKCLECYGVSYAVEYEIVKQNVDWAFAEDTSGGNDEARMCLRSTAGTEWGACEDYEACIKLLAGMWEERVKEGGKPLMVNIVLPEEDILVGKKGMRYFEECWGKERCGSAIEVEVQRVDGANHDSTIGMMTGEMGKLFARVKASA
jgi:hypothetical protein